MSARLMRTRHSDGLLFFFLGLTTLAILPLRSWPSESKNSTPLVEPVCGFTAGPHSYLEASSVRQGLRVELLPAAVLAGQPVTLRFSITQQPKNLPVDKLQIEHEKFMHILGVREDLSEFFHIHPVRTAPGIWEATHSFARAGKYKLWSEVKYLGTSYSFGQPWLTVTGSDPGAREESHDGADCVAVAGCHISFEHSGPFKAGQTNQIRFVARDDSGNPVELENYLGTPMHLFIVNSDASACLHAHPESASALGGMVRFVQTFPVPGTYKMFAQFRPKQNRLPPGEALLAQFGVIINPDK